MKYLYLAAFLTFGLNACNAVPPQIEGPPTETTETTPVTQASMSNDDRQALVNACMDAGENKDYCGCNADAARDHASPELQATLITAAKAFALPEMPADLLSLETHDAYLAAAMICDGSTNLEKGITYCETQGNDRSLCSCRMLKYSNNLDPIAFNGFVSSLGTDEDFAATVSEWGDEYVAQYTTAKDEAATCFSPE